MEALDAVAAGEARVVHGVAGEDAFAFGEGVLEDGAGDVDVRGLGVVEDGLAVLDDDGCWRAATIIGDEEDAAALRGELGEDEVHHAAKHVVAFGDACGEECGEAVDDAEVVRRGGAGLGLGEDDRVVVGAGEEEARGHDAGEGLFDGGVHDLGADDADDVGVCGFGGTEDHEGLADADLIARAQARAIFEADAVNVGAVLTFEVADVPDAVVGRELGVAARDGVVGHGERFAGAADELGLMIGELELASFVGALEHGEYEHG